jgi:plastocyanin
MAFAGAIVIALAAGCGDDDGNETAATGAATTTEATETETTETETETTTTTEASGDGLEVVMKEYEFIPDKITANYGDELTVVNRGRVPHNLTLAFGDRPRAPGNTIVGTEDVEPGRKAELDLGLGPGQFLMICTVPGHLEQGMTGTITVEG